MRSAAIARIVPHAAGAGAHPTKRRACRGAGVVQQGLAFTLALALATSPALAASRQHEHEREAKQPPAPPVATPAPPPDTRPYDQQLFRLAEILGALTYLRGVCGAGDADSWRARMQTLLEAEGKPDARRDRLAGAFNHGMQGYALSYRSCTPNARFVIQRFLAEGADLARGLENRYRPG